MLGREFLEAAERYVQNATEADWRTGISRAYYGVFRMLGELFQAHGLDIRQVASPHASLHQGLQNSGIPAVEQLGRDVDNLRRARTEADYTLTVSLGQGYAKQQVKEAWRIVADFRRCSAPPR